MVGTLSRRSPVAFEFVAKADETSVEVSGRTVRVTNPDKLFFSARGETKMDLIEYYLTMESSVLNALQGRPTMLERYPDGASGKSFFQKRVPDHAPEWLEQTTVATVNGTTSNAMVIADLAHIVWAVNMGCLGFHVWPYRADEAEWADELRIDLDPMPGVAFDQVRDAAALTRDLLSEHGITSYPKTTGSRGIHVYARLEPRWDSYQVRACAVAVARELERREPTLVTAAWWKEERGSRVFVDYNQNAPHKTVFSAWSARARVGGQVSTPFAWSDLESVVPDELTIATVAQYVAERGDAWASINDDLQRLDSLMDQVAIDEAAGLMDAPWPPVYPKMPNEPPRVQPSRARKDPA